jgi:endonuclease/exonuclease/phosphatase family metal-dependent hydrolase
VRLVREARDELPVVSAARRAAMRALPYHAAGQALRALPYDSAGQALRALPTGRELHAALLAELPFLDALECRPGPGAAVLGSSARVVAWNAERCKHLDESARWLERLGADVLLLSEIDWGMARSDQRHAARELAQRLGCGYAFAVEFLELDLGGERERARHAGATNLVGYHGGAILSPHPLLRPAAVRLETEGAWFDGARGERRVGGRIAVLAQLELARVAVTFASVHLESHGDPAGRAAGLAALLAALEVYDRTAPVVIGGDLNTFSLGLAELGDRERVGAALRDDPDRWRHPVPHEPLFALAEAAGFDWLACNALGEPTHRIEKESLSTRGQLKLDWFLCRGLQGEAPCVYDAVDERGVALSDHEAIAVGVRC